MGFSYLGFRFAVLCIHISMASITFIGEYTCYLSVNSELNDRSRSAQCLLLHLLHIASLN
jgi:hypothetical protein